MICKLVASAFVLADFSPPPCFVKFIGYVWASPAAFRVGPVGQMEGNWFHLCASALFHACAEGLAVADEFHVPQSFRLAVAIAPRMRKKPVRRQFSPLGTAGCGNEAAVPHPVLQPLIFNLMRSFLNLEVSIWKDDTCNQNRRLYIRAS